MEASKETSFIEAPYFVENVTHDAFEAPRVRVLANTQKDRRELSLYVRGVVQGMDRIALEKEFSTFGTVKNLDVVKSKSCAFVQFDTQEAYQQALMQKRIIIQDLGTVTVEERKARRHDNRYNRSTSTDQAIESQSSSKHSTWANLAASNPQKWGNSQLVGPKGRVRSTSTDQTIESQSSSKHSTWASLAASNLQKWDNQLAEPKRRVISTNHDQRIDSKEFSLYVKGIIEGMNRKVLEKAFSIFGFVKNLDVVQSKGCAFVEFSTQEAYQQALAQKEITVPNFGIVIVEERKYKKK